MPLPAPIAALPACADELRALLVSWCNENSGSTHEAGLLRMAARLEASFASLPGVTARRISLPTTNAPALLFSVRPDAPRRLLCSGHFDTVYEATHPFQSCSDLPDARLGGPGVADMKGGLVVLFAALRAFEQLPAAPSLGWDVLLTPDEEIGSPHSGDTLRAQAAGHQLALVFEPARANGDLVRSRMGTGVLVATCHGRAAHAAQQPNRGRNAIVALSEFLLRADALPARFPGTLLNIGSITGGGPVNVVPELAEARLNIRAASVSAGQDLLSALHAAASDLSSREGFRLELSGGFERLPKECRPAEEHAFALYQGAFARLGLPAPGWQDVGGGSDGNLFSEVGLPNLDGLGIVGGQLHSAQEYCEPSSLATRAQAAALLLEALAAQPVQA